MLKKHAKKAGMQKRDAKKKGCKKGRGVLVIFYKNKKFLITNIDKIFRNHRYKKLSEISINL